MFAKALRGLRRLAIRFDAWMTEKPKPVAPSKDRNSRHKLVMRSMHENFTSTGGLRRPGDVPTLPYDV